MGWSSSSHPWWCRILSINSIPTNSPTPKKNVFFPPHLVPPLEIWAGSAPLTCETGSAMKAVVVPGFPLPKKKIEAFLCCCEKKWCQDFLLHRIDPDQQDLKKWNKHVLQVLDVLELIMEDIGLFLMGESVVGAKRKSFFTRELWLWEESIVHSPWKMGVGRQLSYLNFRGVIIHISWSQIRIFFCD